FLFVTLFNLQGTRLSGGTFAILARPRSLVKGFFQDFFISFRTRARFRALECSFAILPRRSGLVKSFLSESFQFPSQSLAPLAAVSDSSDSFVRLPRPPEFVKRFFAFFLPFCKIPAKRL
ncbi:hypothetical protein, partial [Oscillibacter sp.]|uniref:hypothetical protein n=1 Tax=Oscillibacter sp. TaxID=1945593 RepID=UPI002D7E2CA3